MNEESSMRWNPDEHFRDLKRLAKQVSKLEETEKAPAEMQQKLAQGVLDLIEHIKKDEEAIYATLERCDGHLTLASLSMYYRSYKHGWERLNTYAKEAKNVLELGDLFYLNQSRELLQRIAEG